jgi:hypothetical protein
MKKDIVQGPQVQSEIDFARFRRYRQTSRSEAWLRASDPWGLAADFKGLEVMGRFLNLVVEKALCRSLLLVV